MPRSNKYHTAEQGFSLVELLIAMTLGLILISSMIAVFSGNKRSSELNSATADLQESARFALDQMARDARIAGYAGCLKLDTSAAINIVANGPPTTDLNASIVTGSVVNQMSEWVPALPGLTAPIDRNAKPGTHVLMLQYGGPDSSPLAVQMLDGPLPSTSADVQTLDNPNLQDGDIALISNCNFGELFRVTGITTVGSDVIFGHDATANAAGSFNRAYGSATSLAETKVMKFQSNVYYIAENGQTNISGQPIYSLYQQSLPYNDLSNPAVELITGVENFRVAYGIRNRTTGGVRYVSAEDPDFDSTAVDSIRLGVLMVSYDEVADVDDETTYFVAGDPIAAEGAGVDPDQSHPKDRRIRLAFSTTVTIRNR